MACVLSCRARTSSIQRQSTDEEGYSIDAIEDDTPPWMRGGSYGDKPNVYEPSYDDTNSFGGFQQGNPMGTNPLSEADPGQTREEWLAAAPDLRDRY